MTMSLYNLFNCNVKVQYKGHLLSQAMLFTLLISTLTIILPFVIAYRSRGFWLKSYSFYEQPKIHFTYDYLLVAETEDPSKPIVCGEGTILNEDVLNGEEYCAETQVQEYDTDHDNRIDYIDFKFYLVVPLDHTITSIKLFLGLDFQLRTVCPLHMQSLAIISKDFPIPPSGFKYAGDMQFYQVSHLACKWNDVDTKYNSSLFAEVDNPINIVDFIFEKYFMRDVITKTKALYSQSRNGHTGNFNLDIRLRIPEQEVLYTPSLMQELKWAWPQYLSILIIFYWVFDGLKRFVFKKRLLMAWEVVPWKK